MNYLRFQGNVTFKRQNGGSGFGPLKINPMKSAFEAGADTIRQFAEVLRTDNKQTQVFRIWASRLGSPLPGGNKLGEYQYCSR